MSAPTRTDDREFNPVYHSYGVHKAGLPPLVPYFKELWHRRGFAAELSKATMRGANSNTFFGQAWLVLNPLLMSGVYYLLVTIVRGRHDALFFSHLTLSLFAFTLIQTAVSSGATSVTGSGKLVMNTAFPRLLIPLSAVRTAFFRFLPTLVVYLFIHAIFSFPGVAGAGRELTWSPRMLLSVYFLLCMVVFGMGLAAIFATMQVYFRDTSSFLPYFLRLWLYLSPVLWNPEMLSGMGREIQTVVQLNPAYHMLTGYADLMQGGPMPSALTWIVSAAVALVVLVIGFLFFMSRERDFAVRLV
jgi:ABC-type polysaccharide/polyol phosphate export permease